MSEEKEISRDELAQLLIRLAIKDLTNGALLYDHPCSVAVRRLEKVGDLEALLKEAQIHAEKGWDRSNTLSEKSFILERRIEELELKIKELERRNTERFLSDVNTMIVEPDHPTIHLLAEERTGWRRYVFGRWVHRSEPFRRDIQRRLAIKEKEL